MGFERGRRPARLARQLASRGAQPRVHRRELRAGGSRIDRGESDGGETLGELDRFTLAGPVRVRGQPAVGQRQQLPPA